MPLQVHTLAGPEAVPVADEDHEWRPGGAQAISNSTCAPVGYLRTGEEMTVGVVGTWFSKVLLPLLDGTMERSGAVAVAAPVAVAARPGGQT